MRLSPRSDRAEFRVEEDDTRPPPAMPLLEAEKENKETVNER
jgi:hypothetical protein